ncbi:tetratricopeptide repeat protein [Fictibacillus sp. Mic-4]|uniref:tetratricopeptide repeat protein n=1 Tax=Fictibacillus sp. Mic-4 TaxID=3132826 RepID=UPI003CF1B239
MEKEKSADTTGRILPFKQDGEYYFQCGLKAYQKRDLHKAKKMFERAVLFEPDEPAFHCQLASTLAELGEFQESNNCLQHVLEYVDGEMAECYFFMANNYAHLGMFKEAEQHAILYMKHEPNGEFFDDSQELLDLIYFETGRPAEQLTEEEELIASHEKARHSIETGNMKEAKVQLKEIIEKHPNFWAAYNNLALTYFYENKYEKALQILEDVLAKNPGNLNALCNMAIFYHHLGQNEKCKKITEALKVIHPIHPEQRYKLGSTFGILGEHTYANRWLVSVKKFQMNYSPAFFHLIAVSYYAIGNVDLAIKYWRKVEEMDPEGVVAPFYLKQAMIGMLTVTGLDYQYRLPPVSNVRKKKPGFFVRLNQIKKALEKNKLTHLILLRGNTNKEAVSLLEAFCLKREEHPFLKEMAANLLLEMEPGRTVVVKNKHEENIYHTVSSIFTKGFDIIDLLKEKEAIIDDEMTFLWLEVMNRAKLEPELLKNEKGMAAALDYLSRKRKQGATQREIAERYGVSVAVLSSRLKKIKKLLEMTD